MGRSMFLGVPALLILVGCQTERPPMYTVPVARDYSRLPKVDLERAEQRVEQAHRAGAQYYSPYEYFSAKYYLDMAYEEKAGGDWPGVRDYAGLAKSMAEAAIRRSPGDAEAGHVAIPESQAAWRAAFERLKARYTELDAAKAVEVAPVLYAHLTAALSRLEHELNARPDSPVAIRALVNAEADIRAIWAQDVDGDRVVDMRDGAPRQPEDIDDFEDEDGVPDPDNDQDGIPDVADAAPLEPETPNRWHDYDGAPDEYPVFEHIFFASGSATLSADAKGYLRGITHVLLEWPKLKMRVKGHTDNAHSERYNLDLSKRRAEQVQRYLVAQGVPEAQLVVTYHGESEPAADNATAAGRDRNRRVELVLEWPLHSRARPLARSRRVHEESALVL